MLQQTNYSVAQEAGRHGDLLQLDMEETYRLGFISVKLCRTTKQNVYS